MLKILFGILIFINAALLAWQQGWFDTLLPASHEPSRLENQLHPERLKLIVPQVQEKPAESKSVEPVARADVVVEANMPACLEIGNFDAADARRFEAQTASLAASAGMTRHAVQENLRYIVHIPPLGSREAAERKGGELARLGVKEYFVIQDASPLQWAISLGVFRTEESARTHLGALNRQGVRSARVVAHGVGGDKAVFRFSGMDAGLRAEIERLRSTAFPRQQWRDCA